MRWIWYWIQDDVIHMTDDMKEANEALHNIPGVTIWAEKMK